MFSLRRLFSLIGSHGIIGPHQGMESELLRARKKPLGLLCTIDARDGEVIDQTAMNRDISSLDEAVLAGILSKHVETIPPMEFWDQRTGRAHFYCQRGLEADMQKIVDFHRAVWRGEKVPALDKDCGLYFGYTDEDVRLFQSGGYGALPLWRKLLMTSTHQPRKQARVAAILPMEPP